MLSERGRKKCQRLTFKVFKVSGRWIVARLGVDAPFELDVRGGAGGVGLGVLRVEEQRSRCVLHRELEALQLQRSDRACKHNPRVPQSRLAERMREGHMNARLQSSFEVIEMLFSSMRSALPPTTAPLAPQSLSS